MEEKNVITNKLQSLKERLRKQREEEKIREEKRKLIQDLVLNWKNTFANIKCKNQEFKTYTLHSIEVTDYGFSCRIYAPWGLALDDLERHRPVIESGLKCIFIFAIPDHRQFAMAKIIKPEQIKCNEIPFKPHKVKPYELYAGVDISGAPIVFDINKTPHVLLAGQTRKGKNGSLDHMVTSLVYWCTEQEIQLYLFQCAKVDLTKYKDCKQVRCFVLGDFKKMQIALEHLMIEMERRSKLMEPMTAKRKGDNIFDYNRLHPNQQLPYIYVIVDEFMVLMFETKDKEIKEAKEKILEYLARIAEFGGSLGITYIVAHQKPEKALMPTFLKNMSLIRICFGFDDESCGRIVLSEKYGDLVIKLPARRAYYSADSKIDLLFTTNLRGYMDQYISKAEEPKHRTLFDDLEKLKKDFRVDKLNNTEDNSENNKEQPKEGVGRVTGVVTKNKPKNDIPKENKTEHDKLVESIKFDKVDPEIKTKEQNTYIENVKNIPNFVPYIDYSKVKNTKVIDQTKLPAKTEKPRKEA